MLRLLIFCLCMLSRCKILDLPKVTDVRGNLTFVQPNELIDFHIQRVYYLYDVPAGAERGGHAHKLLSQLLIPVSGSFDVNLYDGKQRQTFTLNKPYQGLFICPMIWRDICNFSSGSVCLVLASRLYEENDYIRSISEFEALS